MQYLYRKKAVPEVVSEKMIEEQSSPGHYTFLRQEWLSPAQIKYLFARFAREKKSGKSDTSEPDIEEVSFISGFIKFNFL